MMRASTLMGTSALTMKNLCAYDCLVANGTYMQSKRWKRKPIWLPTAKTKVFRVPKRPELPTGEVEEIKRLYNNYRTYMKSLMHYFQEEAAKQQVQVNEEAIRILDEEDFARCSAINDAWNKEIAKEREIRLAQKWEAEKEEILQKIEKHHQQDKERQEEIEANIRKLKELAPTFITPENIDKAIAEVLETVVDHNKAIDLNGNFYVGKDTKLVDNNKIEERLEVQQ